MTHGVGDGIGDGDRPTFGTNRLSKQMVHFMEIGSSICKDVEYGDDGHSALCDTIIQPFFLEGLKPGIQRSCYIMWFIDEHDSLEEVLAARNHVTFIRSYFATRISLGLCIVHNIGRPRDKRRLIDCDAKGQVAWREPSLNSILKARQPVPWEILPDIIGFDGLSNLFPRSCMTQLSYTDRNTIYKIMDWLKGII